MVDGMLKSSSELPTTCESHAVILSFWLISIYQSICYALAFPGFGKNPPGPTYMMSKIIKLKADSI